MRHLSAAAIKQSTKRGKNSGRPLQLCPKKGTFIRAIFDEFQRNKGKEVGLYHLPRPMINTLIDIWGLDIRLVRRGFVSKDIKRPSVYILVGEWFGKVYVDYLAETLKDERKPKPDSRKAAH